MDRFQYLGVLIGCVLVTLPLEFVAGARVGRRPARTFRAIAPAFLVFVAWDLWASHRGTWDFADRYTLGVRFPGGMVLEELLFFVVVPICALLTYETVRIMQQRRVAVVTADTEPPAAAKVRG
jgi:lycopene cyclase domain-containing protein